MENLYKVSKQLYNNLSFNLFGGSNPYFEIIFVRHAETDMNFKGLRYDNFEKNEYYPITDRGIKMAIETGKYLKKYGNFDLVISSPRDRCLQTAEIIVREIGYKGKIQQSDLLLESKAGKLNLMNKKEIRTFIAKNPQLKELQSQIKDETNEFMKLKLAKKYNILYCKYTEQSNYEEIETHYRDFLDYVKKLDHKRILVVCHHGTIHKITHMIANIEFNATADVYPNKYTIFYIRPKQNFFNGNCTLMGMRYKNKCFKIVIPPNNLHLEQLADKYS